MIQRRLVLAAGLAGLGGCATRVFHEDRPPRLEVQDYSLLPAGATIATSALQPGDILLSSADSLTSAGIRVLTLSPVSHACLYMGDGLVAEAVGEGIRRRAIEPMLREEAVVVAFRHPRLEPQHLPAMRDFVRETEGQKYNYFGVMLQAPFSIERRVCEMPLTPVLLRDICVQGVGAIQLGLGRNDRFFCSQFVLEAYRRAGLPLTAADPRLLSPADLMHMREGDVPAVRSHQALLYVGHLKYQPVPA